MADCTGVFLLGKRSDTNSCKICLDRRRERLKYHNGTWAGRNKRQVCVLLGVVHMAAYTFRANHQERVATGKGKSWGQMESQRRELSEK